MTPDPPHQQDHYWWSPGSVSPSLFFHLESTLLLFFRINSKILNSLTQLILQSI